MSENSYRFLDPGLAEKLLALVDQFCENDSAPDQLLAKVKELVPLNREDQKTLKIRVEGYFEVSGKLFEVVLANFREKHGGDYSREKLIGEAKIHPFDYYHRVAGMRDGPSEGETREDYLDNPATALVKLEDDILSLARMCRSLSRPAETPDKEEAS